MSWIMRCQLGSVSCLKLPGQKSPRQPGKEEEVEVGKVTDGCRAAGQVEGTRVSSLYSHSTPSLSSHSTRRPPSWLHA